MYFANMKRDNKIGPPVLGGLPQPKKMAAADLAKLDASAVAIVDTRDWDDFRSGHIAGSLSFPADQVVQHRRRLDGQGQRRHLPGDR
jgi:hydroxyacylglutathione hydrolase